MVDPFILLHHYQPYQIIEANNTFDLDRFDIVDLSQLLFLIQGEQSHRDSLGNFQ